MTATDGFVAIVERSRLRSFAAAIGETDPRYVDVTAARAAGHPDLPVPPTFLFGLELDRPDPFGWLTDLGIDLARVLHGEQSFTYHAMAHAGDELRFDASLTGRRTAKGGALELLDRAIEVSRDGSPVATLRQVVVAPAVRAC